MLNVWNSESGGHSSDPSSAANCVSLDSTKMIAAWRELSPHRHWRAGTLPCGYAATTCYHCHLCKYCRCFWICVFYNVIFSIENSKVSGICEYFLKKFVDWTNQSSKYEIRTVNAEEIQKKVVCCKLKEGQAGKALCRSIVWAGLKWARGSERITSLPGTEPCLSGSLHVLSF